MNKKKNKINVQNDIMFAFSILTQVLPLRS